MINLEKLLSQMTIDEKIGQMSQVVFSVFTNIAEKDITGLGGDDATQKFNTHHLGSAIGTVTAERAIFVQKEHLNKDRNKIPLLFMRDVIHGHTTVFPIPLGMGCTFDPDLMEKCSYMASKESAVTGLHVTFNPMVDYVRDPRWGRVMESCGEDAYLNGLMGAAVVRGFQGEDLKNQMSLATCVKHFAAYGGAEAGRDYNCAEVSEYSLREYYLPAYKACIDAGAELVMPSFNTVNGIPVNGNSHLMKEILRDEWGFNGVVISDWGAISQCVQHGYTENEKEAAKIALNNECDIEMCTYAYVDNIKELLDEETITIEQIDSCVMRILKLKEKLGLFENPYHGASIEKERELLLCKEHRDLARCAAENAAVLLKNNGVLPFDDSVKNIALVGPFAQEHAINGKWSCCGKAENTVSVLQGISNLLPNANITVVDGCTNLWDDADINGIDKAVEAAKSADAVIICVGEPESYSGEGNCRVELRLPGVQEELVRRVCEANQNSAVVLFNGRPLVLTEVNKVAPAILEMWYPGTEGGNAAAKLLFGKANPSGKLSMSFPKAVGQCPLYYNHANTGHPVKDAEERHIPFASNYIDCGNLPLFSFGHGLSYGKFEYRDLEISTDVVAPDETITVSIRVANTGSMAGREVVQLYMRDHFGTTVRPIQELIDFTSVWLEPGEEKIVTFTVDESKLIMWTSDGKFESEPGMFSLYTGHADHLLFETQFRLIK